MDYQRIIRYLPNFLYIIEIVCKRKPVLSEIYYCKCLMPFADNFYLHGIEIVFLFCIRKLVLSKFIGNYDVFKVRNSKFCIFKHAFLPIWAINQNHKFDESNFLLKRLFISKISAYKTNLS